MGPGGYGIEGVPVPRVRDLSAIAAVVARAGPARGPLKPSPGGTSMPSLTAERQRGGDDARPSSGTCPEPVTDREAVRHTQFMSEPRPDRRPTRARAAYGAAACAFFSTGAASGYGTAPTPLQLGFLTIAGVLAALMAWRAERVTQEPLEKSAPLVYAIRDTALAGPAQNPS